MVHEQSDNSCKECGKAWPCPVSALEAERSVDLEAANEENHRLASDLAYEKNVTASVRRLLRAEREALAKALDERDYYRNQVDGLVA